MGGGEVVKKGWLIKSPPLEGGGIKAWRKRFFMLRSSKVLEYYKGSDGDVLKGVINLEDCKTVHSDLSHKKHKFVFDIETKDRIYYLVAQSQEEMKAWVDVLCSICGLSVQEETEFLPTVDSVTLSPSTTNGGPSITHPIYATPPSRGATGTGSVGVPFSERFKPSSEPPAMESMYSLAHSVETEVQRQLSGEQEVAAGTPLAEALVYKGISTRTSSVSSASGGDTNTSLGSDSPSFFSPRQEPALDMQNLYSPVPKKPSSGGAAVGGATRPVPKPRAATTLTPNFLDARNHQLSASMSDASGGGSPVTAARGARAETLANGYMQPRHVKKVGNYDQLPLGPPRPAVPDSYSPKQHRSALLRPEQGDPLRADQGAPAHGELSEKKNASYINVQHMADDLPPMIDRTSKPLAPSPPRVERHLKPKSELEGSPDISGSLRLPDPLVQHSTPSAESPPMFPTRTTSLNPSLNPSMENCTPHGQAPHSGQLDDTIPPDFPERTTSLANTLEASGLYNGEDFSDRDMPKPTARTMQYTQVSFDDSGRPAMSELGHDPDHTPLLDIKRAPVPTPRGRVTYSDVDLARTKGLSREVTLREAERQALQDKPYVNVKKEGDVDEDSDPGYYTHMRNLTYQEALEIYNLPPKSIDEEDSEEEMR